MQDVEQNTPQATPSPKPKKSRRWLSNALLVLAGALLATGLYTLLLVGSPAILKPKPIEKATISEPTIKTDRIIIPKVGIDIEYKSGTAAVLNDYAWHRFPDRGNPADGGNFIISAHRFVIGLTPGETAKKSPFYHIEKVAVGDEILVDYQGKRYTYKVTERTKVKPTQVEIEEASTDAKLTLYTCTLGGETDGREVFTAKLQ